MSTEGKPESLEQQDPITETHEGDGGVESSQEAGGDAPSGVSPKAADRFHELAGANRDLRKRLEDEREARIRMEGRLEELSRRPVAPPPREPEPQFETEYDELRHYRAQDRKEIEQLKHRIDADRREREIARSLAQAVTGLSFGDNEEEAKELVKLAVERGEDARLVRSKAESYAKRWGKTGNGKSAPQDPAKYAEKKEQQAATVRSPRNAGPGVPTLPRPEPKSVEEGFDLADAALLARMEKARVARG